MFLYLRSVPGFWTALEEHDRPEMRDRPLIMGGLPSQRGTVREVNRIAGHRGVRPGMSLAQAHQLCPEGTFLVPDIPRYEGAWETLCDIVRGYTPAVEPIEMGQVIADLTGCERLWGDAPSVARKVITQVRERIGIYPWVGIASNHLVARLASTMVGVDGIAVIEKGHEQSFLADLPITLLPDVDPRLALTFQVLGLRTIGQFAALSPAAVAGRFGAAGQRLHRYARGNDPRPVNPPATKPSITAQRECDDGSIEEAHARLHDLAEECAAELQQHGLAGRLVALRLWWEEADGRAVDNARGREATLDAESREAWSLPNVEIPPVPHPTLPIPYRIHSMLPQPGLGLVRTEPELPAPTDEDELPARTGGQRPDKAMMAVREPISSAAALFEKAQQLLLQSWRQMMKEGRHSRLLSLRLEISEFQEPVQLSFDGLNRLGQTGSLGGSITVRHQLVAEQDRILTARYGEEPFRHITRVDPSSILTERRFQWRAGLPWKEAPTRTRRSGARPGSRRRKS